MSEAHEAVTFCVAYIHRDDVARFEAEGWHEVGVDPRYGSRIMRRDGALADAPRATRRLTEGAG